MYTEYSQEQLQKNFEIILTLEYMGIHIEDVKEINNKYGIPSKTAYYFSVPETSTVEIDDKDVNRIQTSEGLISIAKETLVNMLIDSCIDEFGDDEEFIEDVKNNQSDYFKFYAKVRTGEEWNDELGKAAIKKIADEVKANSYKEV